MTNLRHRPPRLERVFQELASFYFVTFNTCNRRPLLANNTVHEAFLRFAERGREEGVAIGRYVLMPDHVHLFVMLPPTGRTLPSWVKALKTVLEKALIEKGHSKPHWQEGFFDHLMRSSESYSEKWNYVRQNPVRAKLCQSPEDWPFQGECEIIRF